MDRPALEQIRRRGYELVVLHARTTRVPRGWHQLVQGLESRVQRSGYGLLLSVRTELSSEIDRLLEQLYQMPWADEITHTWTSEFDEITVHRWRPGPEERALAERSPVHAIEMPFSLACGAPVTPEAVMTNRDRVGREITRIREAERALKDAEMPTIEVGRHERPALPAASARSTDSTDPANVDSDQADVIDASSDPLQDLDLPDGLIEAVAPEVTEALDMMGSSTIEQLIVYTQQPVDVLRKTLARLVSEDRVIEQDGVFSVPPSGDRDPG